MKYKIPDDLLLQNVVDEMVILEPGSGTYFTLDAVGARMVNVFRETADVEEAVSVLSGEYDADAETLKADLLELLDKMVAAGLLEKA